MAATIFLWGVGTLLAVAASAAIVRVDMAANAPPPAGRADEAELPAEAPGGVPIDFRYYAARKYRTLAEAEAIKKAQEDFDVIESGGPQSSEGAVVENMLTHPGLYVSEKWIEADENVPLAWHAAVNEKRGRISAALRAVGRIQVYHADDVPAIADGMIVGTGFLVAPNIVMTNRHVAARFCEIDQPAYPFLKDGRNANVALVKINFAGTRDDSPVLRKVLKTLYVGPEDADDGHDVALLEIEPSLLDPYLRKPIPLQTQRPSVDYAERRMYLCGYPTQGGSKYLKTLRVKRLSLGRLMSETEWHNHNRLYHNCLTTPGSSGSPLIDLETGTVWGLHFQGESSENIAEPMWEVCQNAEVQKHLGASASAPPPEIHVAVSAAPKVADVQRTRPVLFVCGGDVAEESISSIALTIDPDEFDRLRGMLRRVAPSVGLVSHVAPASPSEDGSLTRHGRLVPLSTGFLIAPGILVTPHEPTGLDDPEERRFVVQWDRSVCEGRHAQEGAVTELEPIKSFRIDRSRAPRIRLFRVRPAEGETLPPPLALDWSDRPDDWRGAKVFTVGHPGQDARMPESVFVQAFPPPYGVKRLAQGQVVGISRPANFQVEFEHDCSTAGGDGGAPLVSTITGKVIGMHYGGRYLRTNFAIPIYQIMRDEHVKDVPEIAQLLDSLE